MPTLHVGPVTFTGSRDTVDWVNRQVRWAALRCRPVWLGGFTVEVTINEVGGVERVTFDRDVDPRITLCVGPLLRDGWFPEDPPGPGAATVRAGYLMRMTRN